MGSTHEVAVWRTTEELRRKGLFGLLPLLILTKEGHSREVVEEVIAQLMPVEEEPKRELLSLTYGLASLAFEDHPADLEWLARRFEMLQDLIVKMSMAQTIEEARQQLLDVVENEEEDE